MTVSEAQKLIDDGIIAGGMLPKLKTVWEPLKTEYQEYIF